MSDREADSSATLPGTRGRCTGCGELFLLVDSTVPPHMWPYSTPLIITCSGGNQPPAGSNARTGETSGQ